MKKAAIIIVFMGAILLAILLPRKEANCVNCSGVQCTADTQCAPTFYCYCHKPRNSVYGTCIAQ